MKSSGLIKIFGALLAGMIALLGFSCDKVNDTMAEYGVPHADYRVIGTVVDDQTRQPLGGAQVKFYSAERYQENSDNNYPVASGESDSEGRFDIEGQAFPRIDFILTVEGNPLSGYQRKELPFNYEGIKFEGGAKTWYEGKATYDFGMIRLKKSEETSDDTVN